MSKRPLGKDQFGVQKVMRIVMFVLITRFDLEKKLPGMREEIAARREGNKLREEK